jgi:hypothetical protein
VGGQRKKKGGRVTPKGSGGRGRFTPAEQAGLEEIFESILRSAPKALTDDLHPLAVEMWASQMWSIWATSELADADAIEVFAGGIIKYAAKRTTPGALMVLRALGAVAPEPYGSRARRTADRLAAAGATERRWAAVVGTGRPMTAYLTYDPIDDDGVTVMVEFDGPGQPSTVGVYVDHNLGGMAKDAFDVPAGIDDVLARLQEDHDDLEELEYSEIPLDEADARWREAFEVTDMTFEPPTSEDLDHLRALVMTRFTTLPDHGKVPEPAGLGEEEREQLLAEFCQSDEAAVLLGPDGDDNEDDTVEDLAYQILTFSSDYVRGTPLRFSPVMVEIFCLDWAPRKIAVDGDGFTLLPDVLAAWIRFVGRRRGIPEHSIKDAVEAAHEYAPVMIELSQDPEEWGPAKTMALALQGRGIDITDQAALDDFVDEVNRNGGVDVLANSLTASVAPRR